jgi:hypothetical protein
MTVFARRRGCESRDQGSGWRQRCSPPGHFIYDYAIIGRALWLDIFSTASGAAILQLPRHQASLLLTWLELLSPAWSWRVGNDRAFFFSFCWAAKQTKVLNHVGYEEGAARRYTPLSDGTAILRPGLLLLDTPVQPASFLLIYTLGLDCEGSREPVMLTRSRWTSRG